MIRINSEFVVQKKINRIDFKNIKNTKSVKNHRPNQCLDFRILKKNRKKFKICKKVSVKKKVAGI